MGVQRDQLAQRLARLGEGAPGEAPALLARGRAGAYYQYYLHLYYYYFDYYVDYYYYYYYYHYYYYY